MQGHDTENPQRDRAKLKSASEKFSAQQDNAKLSTEKPTAKSFPVDHFDFPDILLSQSGHLKKGYFLP